MLPQRELHALHPFTLDGTIPTVTCMGDYIYIKNKQIHSCSICGKELVYSGDRKLVTLDEHVSNPNGETASKFCFVCENKYCLASILGFGWNSQGDFYTLGRYVPTDHIKFIDNLTASLGSWQRDYDEKIAWEKSRTFRVPIGPKVGVFGQSLMVLEFQLYPNNPIHWNVTIWWKGCYWTCFPHSIIWNAKRYLNKKKDGCNV